ncbi:MAG: hypothetical protein COV76_06385 [Candidatus Omnitrophica bacterium CG11_big_fil_rev_8_21_14_0_20_64_10]|nr:MAG: hypothetical protein COV76_06385 [Candidatus Omnitrophica bacterium CG11_big_fil_rev_8_21_14_0_20_64_10]
MAETLGSLVDKLSIRQIREITLKEMLKKAGPKRGAEIRAKLAPLKRQLEALRSEIDAYLTAAAAGRAPLRDEKLKLYNKPEQMNRIGTLRSVAETVGSLARKNLELWRLEDEARRKDISLARVGKVKQKIDAANQQRNDLIDKVDELLAKQFPGRRRRRTEKAIARRPADAPGTAPPARGRRRSRPRR